jgi:sialic acid synthase SpsE
MLPEKDLSMFMGEESYQKYAKGKTGEKLYSILNELIKISREQQETYKSEFSRSVSWAKEYCTIRLKVARQSGHTYAMIETSLSRFSKSIIISKGITANSYIKKSIKEQRGCQKGNIILLTTYSLENIKGLNDIEAVFVDRHSTIDKTKEEEIYKTCLPLITDKPFFFILVQ